jgi:hypothetical protein
MTDEENLEMETGLLKAVYPVYVDTVDRLCAKLPPATKSSGDTVRTFTDFEKMFAATDAEAYRDMFDSDFRKLVSAGAYCLAYRQVVENHGEEFQHRPHWRAETERENFLFRAISCRDKSYQIWNASKGFPIPVDRVSKKGIKAWRKEQGLTDTDSFFAELMDVWGRKPFSDIADDRNASAHQHSFDGIGIGFPVVGPPEKTVSGYRTWGVGATVGKVDWALTQATIEKGVEVAILAREIIAKHVATLSPPAA